MSNAFNLSQLANNINTSGQVSLTAGVTGTLPIANGGTNSTATPTAGGAIYGTGTSLAATAAGISGQALVSNGSSAPTWGIPSSASSLITTNFSISESGGKLVIKYGSTIIASISSSGEIISANNITAYGTP